MFLRTLEAVAAADTTLANSLCNRETTGLDLIMERLGQALAGGAHPRRI